MEGKRKFIFFTIMLAVLVMLARIAGLGDDAIESMFWAIALGFAGGNGAEHFAKRAR